MLEAVRDLLGIVQLGRDLGEGERVDPGEAPLRALDPATLVAGGALVSELGGRREWAEVLELVRAAGRDLLLARAGAADLRAGQIEVVKALVVGGTSGEH